MIEVWWSSGTCSTTSPGLFRPPVSSEPTSQAAQPSSVQASQTTGGRRGSTPRPDTWQSSRSSTAQDGTASDSPISSASPTTGVALKQPGTRRDRAPWWCRSAVAWFGWVAGVGERARDDRADRGWC